jgi:Ca-activated chloride channel family protein
MHSHRPQPPARICTAVLAVLSFTLPAALAAQGWIELADDRGDRVVRLETDVRVRVVDQVAQVEVTEWFENRSRGVAEGSYLYPLPGEAVFGSFSLWQGDQELRGEVLDAHEAREIYESIVRRRADPALIELAGTGLLRARVFPIEPGQKRKVTLRYTQVLEHSGDALQFRYALGSGGASNVFPTRVEPGPRPWPVPGGRPLPAEGDDRARSAQPTKLELELVAEDGRRFLAPFSPTHDLEHEMKDGRLVVRADGELRGRLSVFLPLAKGGVGVSLATHRTPGEAGYFMLTLTPGAGETSAEPRDVTVVLDVSGSMSGEKMEQARSAVLHLLETLAPRDRFRLVAFSNRVRAQSDGWLEAEEGALRESRAWVERLQADGGTDISGALEEALRLESPEGRLPIVAFLTDGLPTAGERSPARIAERAERARGRTRIFAFGVGHDVDTHLLDALSAAARGTTTYVEPGESVARALELLAAKVRHPGLTDLESADAPVTLTEIYPVTLPDLFAGESLVLFGRYPPGREGQLRVSGQRGGEVLGFSLAATFPAAQEANEYIPRLWASRKVGHLSRQIRLEGSSEELVEEIRRTALRYGLPSDYTSYLVLEPGVMAEGVRGTPPPAVPVVGTGVARREVTTGAQAVQAAAGQARMRDARSGDDLAEVERAFAKDEALSDVRPLGGRLFRLEEGVWTEVHASSFTAEPRSVAIKLYSTAYFQLLRTLPELVPLAAALGRFQVRGEAVSLRVTDEGREALGPDELRALTRDFRGAPAVPDPFDSLEERR